MRRKANFSSKAGGLSALMMGTAVAATVSDAAAQEWTKHFRLGMQLTLNIDAEFMTGGTPFTIAHEPGEFDDGYVRADMTGDPTETTNWGYQNASQFDDGILTFTRTDAFLAGTARREIDDNPYLGIELAYGGPITRWKGALLGWEVAYSWLPIHIQDRTPLMGTGNRTESLHPIADEVLLADPPYNGSVSGHQGALIPLVNPTSFVDTSGVLTGSRALDVSLHNLRFGPTLHYEFARRWAVQGSVGGAIGLVSGDYVFNETMQFSTGPSTLNRGKIGMSDFVYGGYINSVVLFHVEPHGDIYAGVQFMSLSDTEVNDGGRRARLNLGAAFSLLIGVNWPF